MNDIVKALSDLSESNYARLRLIKREKVKAIMIFISVVSKT